MREGGLRPWGWEEVGVQSHGLCGQSNKEGHTVAKSVNFAVGQTPLSQHVTLEALLHVSWSLLSVFSRGKWGHKTQFTQNW